MEHHIYRLWDLMKHKPICTCSSDVQHQQLNYNCYFRSKHNPEQETTLKWWGTALSWICHQTLQRQPSSSSALPEPGRTGAFLDWGRTPPSTTTSEIQYVCLGENTGTSGHILFSKDVLMYFGRSGLCALLALLLAFCGLRHSGGCHCTGPTVSIWAGEQLDCNWKKEMPSAFVPCILPYAVG